MCVCVCVCFIKWNRQLLSANVNFVMFKSSGWNEFRNVQNNKMTNTTNHIYLYKE